jgi:hypothetical protein
MQLCAQLRLLARAWAVQEAILGMQPSRADHPGMTVDAQQDPCGQFARKVQIRRFYMQVLRWQTDLRISRRRVKPVGLPMAGLV